MTDENAKSRVRSPRRRAVAGGRRKRTSTRTRRTKHLTRRSPLAKTKVVKRSTRRRVRRSKCA